MKLTQHFEILDLFIEFVVSIGPDFLCPDALQNILGLPGIVPEVVLVGNAFFVFDLSSFAIVVKDTSLGRRYEPLSPSIVQ
jgi:hypothetical protein